MRFLAGVALVVALAAVCAAVGGAGSAVPTGTHSAAKPLLQGLGAGNVSLSPPHCLWSQPDLSDDAFSPDGGVYWVAHYDTDVVSTHVKDSGYHEIIVKIPMKQFPPPSVAILILLYSGGQEHWLSMAMSPRRFLEAVELLVIEPDGKRSYFSTDYLVDETPCHEVYPIPGCDEDWTFHTVAIAQRAEEPLQMWFDGEPITLGAWASETLPGGRRWHSFSALSFQGLFVPGFPPPNNPLVGFRSFPETSCLQSDWCLPGTCDVPGSVCRRPGRSCDCEDPWQVYPNCGPSHPDLHASFLANGRVEMNLCPSTDLDCISSECMSVDAVGLEQCIPLDFTNPTTGAAYALEFTPRRTTPGTYDWIEAHIWQNEATQPENAACEATDPDYVADVQLVPDMNWCSQIAVRSPPDFRLAASAEAEPGRGAIMVHCNPECPGLTECVQGHCVCIPGIHGDPATGCMDFSFVCLQDCDSLQDTGCFLPFADCDCWDLTLSFYWHVRQFLGYANSDVRQIGCPEPDPPALDPNTMLGFGPTLQLWYREGSTIFAVHPGHETVTVKGAGLALGLMVWIPLDFSDFTSCDDLPLTDNMARCEINTTQPGEYTLAVFSIFDEVAISADRYVILSRPEINWVSGCPFNLERGDTACSTDAQWNGNKSWILIDGARFYPPVTVVIGTSLIEVPLEHMYGEDELVVEVPPGTGTVGVSVIARGGMSDASAAAIVTYAPSTITAIHGCGSSSEVIDGIIALSRCPKTSNTTTLISGEGDSPTELYGEIITVDGRNFGPDGAVVLVGGQISEWVQHVDGASHTLSPARTDCVPIYNGVRSQLQFLLPNGTGLARDLVILQRSGSPSLNRTLLSYEPCPKGFVVSGLECDPCQPGYFSNTLDAASCSKCPEGSYSSTSNASECTLCPVQTYNDEEAQAECQPCVGNTYQNNEGGKICVSCGDSIKAPLASGDGYGCLMRCASGKYPVVRNGTYDGDCNDCPQGADCHLDGIYARQNYWLVRDEFSGQIRSYFCQPGHCLSGQQCQSASPVTDTCEDGSSGGPKLGAPGAEVHVCCGQNRRCHRENALCGSCSPGTYEWKGTCVSCDEGSAAGIVILLVIVCVLWMVLFHRVSQTTRGDSKILLFFVQMSLLFLGGLSSSSAWLSWMSVFNFNLLDTAGTTCILPLDPLPKMMMGIVVPLFCLLLLLPIAAVHWAYDSVAEGRGRTPDQRHKLLEPGRYNRDRYIRSVVAFLIFAYNQITITVLQFFDCVDVAQTNGQELQVIRTYPAVECGSGEYNRALPGMILLLLLVVTGFPVALLLWVINAWRNGLMVRYSPEQLAHFEELQEQQQQRYSGPFSGRMAAAEHEQSRHQVEDMRQVISFQSRWGIIYETYNRRSFFYEFVVMVRRVLAIAVTVAIASHQRMFSVLSVCNLAFLITHVYFQPFDLAAENIAETVSLAALTTITALLASMDLPLNDDQVALFACLVFIPASAMLFYAIWLSWTNVQSRRKLQDAGERPLEVDPVGDEEGAGQTMPVPLAPEARATASPAAVIAPASVIELEYIPAQPQPTSLFA